MSSGRLFFFEHKAVCQIRSFSGISSQVKLSVFSLAKRIFTLNKVCCQCYVEQINKEFVEIAVFSNI